MKTITQKEFDKLQFTTSRTIDPVLQRIQSLRIGKGLIVQKSEWTHRTAFYQAVHSLTRPNSLVKGVKFSVCTLAYNTGWAVLRVK